MSPTPDSDLVRFVEPPSRPRTTTTTPAPGRADPNPSYTSLWQLGGRSGLVKGARDDDDEQTDPGSARRARPATTPAPRVEPSLDRAARHWDEDERPSSGGAGDSGFALLDDEEPHEDAPSPVSARRTDLETATDETTGPLRVFLGNPPGTRSKVPKDGKGPVFDASNAGQSNFDTEEIFPADSDTAERTATSEEDIEQRAPGELPRTWLDPSHLPPALDRPFGARPRRVGAVVQPVPGTPSAIAIAREEAEVARYGPPPPLVSPPPAVFAGASSVEDEIRTPPGRVEPPSRGGGAGFQILPDPPSPVGVREPPMVVGGPSPRVTVAPAAVNEQPRKPPPRTGDGGSRLLYYGVAITLFLLIVSAGLYYLRGRSGGQEPTRPLPAPELTAPPTEAPPTPTPEPTPAPTPPTDAAPTPTPGPANAIGADGLVQSSLPLEESGFLDVKAYQRQGGEEVEVIAMVYVDGQKVGKTPFPRIQLAPRAYMVRVDYGGRSRSQSFRVDAGAVTQARFNF